MPVQNTIDERYQGGATDLGGFANDAPGTLNKAYALANGQTGYGGLITESFFGSDSDVYTLGKLRPGTYSVDVDRDTWDPASMGFLTNVIDKFEVVDAYGTAFASTTDLDTDLTFSVGLAAVYYLRVVGGGSYGVQYTATYEKTGPVTINKEAGNNSGNTLNGTSGIDKLLGRGGNDTLSGRDGNDILVGGAGNDILRGGDGADIMTGNRGRDTMFAGKDGFTDVFVYKKASDSKTGSNKRDKINQFDSGEDKIDLSSVDGNTAIAGNQSLGFSNAPNANNAIWLVDAGKNVLVRADVNGDGNADFEIQVNNVSGTGLAEADFLL